MSITEKQFDEYIKQMNKAFDVEFYELNQNTFGYDTISKSKTDKLIRIVSIKQDKLFPTNDETYKMGFVTYSKTKKVAEKTAQKVP